MSYFCFKREKYFFLVLFLMACFVRFYIFSIHLHKEAQTPIYDAAQYQEVALQISKGKGIATQDGKPSFYRLPGYSMYLGLCYTLFGTSNFGALVFQIILASLIPILLFLLSLSLFPKNILLARIVGIIGVIHPGFVIHAGTLLSESLFLIFFLIFLLFFFKSFIIPEHKISRILFIAGLFLGVSSLIRAIGHYMIFLILLMLVFSLGFSWHVLRRFLLILSGWIFVVMPWLLRNFLLTGYIFFHTLPGLHFLQYSATYNVMDVLKLDQDNYMKARQKLLDQWDTEVQDKESMLERKLNELERYDVAQNIAIKHLLASPLLTLKHAIKQMAKTCCTLYSSWILYVPPGTVYLNNTSLWRKMQPYFFPSVEHKGLIPFVYLDIFLYGVTLLGCLFFLLQFLFAGKYKSIFLNLFLLVAMFIFITLAYGCARLRLPIEGILLICAGQGWLQLLQGDNACKE